MYERNSQFPDLCNVFFSPHRNGKEALSAPSAGATAATDEEAKEKVDLSMSSSVICGQGGNYFDARANLEDDGGFSAFCRMVERYAQSNVSLI